jgi:hypothetical protein
MRPPPFPIEPGDRIKLNTTAQAWTRNRSFIVDEIYDYGVLCYDQDQLDGRAYYRASWAEIEAPA